MNPWALIGLLCAAAPAVEVALRSPVPGATAAMPCRFGVVLPPGWAAETRDIRAAEGDAGRPIAVDWTPVARWPGGTLRWVRGRASLEFRSGQARRLLLRPEPGGVARDGTSGGRLVLRTDDRFHEIREEEGSRPAARSLRACLGGGPLLWELRGGGLTWFAAGAGPELAWRREDGGRIAGTLEDVRPEGASSGCSIGLTARGAAGNGGLFRTRAEVWSGSFLLELEAAIESWPLEATAVGWEFGWPAPLTELAFRSARTRRISRRKCGQMRLVVAEGGAAELSADGRALGGDGPEATTLGLGFGSAWVVLDLGDAAVRGGVEVRAERGGVSVVLRQNVESFKADRRLTLRVVFGFANGPPPAALWNAVRAAGGYGGGVAVLRADAVDRWGGLGTWRAAAASAAAEDAIRESVALAVAEMGRPESMGADDFGDYRLPTLGWANAEYDAIRVLAQCHFRTQDPELLAWTRRAVRHHLDVDLDFKHTGLPRVHGTDHDGGHELGHTWIRGLLAHALLRGDEAALEAARGIARGIVSWVEGTRGALRLERDYGWALLALTTAADLFPGERFEAARDRVAAEFRPFLHDSGLVLLELTRNPTVARTATFTALGVVVPALVAYARAAGAPEWNRRAAAMVRRYLAEAWDPETERLAWTLFVDASSGQVIGRRGQVEGAELMFVAAGAAVAAGGEEMGLALRQARSLADRGLRAFRREGHGTHNGERIKALSALLELGPD